MSHGSTEKCEPNFTPLLDLVLQLVMFFMLCANFVLEQTAVEIKLPEAIAAKALDKNEGDPIFLNINSKGQVLLSRNQMEDKEALDTPPELEAYLKRAAKREYRATTRKAEDPPIDWKPQTTLIMRIDKDTTFEKSYPLMKACRQANYSKVELRAILGQ
ncbi:MAG: hypothetical protein C0501_09505 [Isosphaera sp.]|nr:hypothetical protein [Isosphaera sp.]